ncbi:LysR family transcriptional regulator ArgP [Neptunomonas sp.]|uniref:LysR family transcriptional regulator ArgP n=1 Tax=Neptunomonas sp. TaxID=1971898 RepID=UPI003562D3FD
MVDYKQLKALSTVLEEKNFERAAKRLHVTQSAVSQRIKQLEEMVGQTLLIRSHPITPTPAGQTLLKHFRQIEMLQNEVMSELNPVLKSGHIRLSIGVNADSLSTWFLPAIDPILKQHNVLLDLKVDDQDQTHHLLRSGEVMGCITSSPTPLQGCHCIPLGVSVYRCLASPEYIQHYFPNGCDKQQLMRAPIVEYNYKDALQHRYLSKFFDISQGDYPAHRVPSFEAFIDFITRGFAAGMIPDQQGDIHLKSGQLIDIKPGYFLSVPLYWHVWNLKIPLANTLTNALIKQSEIDLEPFSKHPELTAC